MNDRLAEAYGTEPAELVGTESWTHDHVVAEHGEEAFEALVEGDRAELRLETELDLPEHGSSVMDVRLTRLPRSGEFEGIVGIGRDVTVQKRREQRLQRGTSASNGSLARSATTCAPPWRSPAAASSWHVTSATANTCRPCRTPSTG